MKGWPLLGILLSKPTEVVLSAVFVGWVAALLQYTNLWSLIILFIIFDIASGFLVAIKRKKMKSAIMSLGLGKKLAFLVLLALTVILFSTPPVEVSVTLVLWAYAATELVSIVENITSLFGENKVLKIIKKMLDKELKNGK